MRRRRGQSLLHISCSCRNGRCTSTPLRYLQAYPDTGPLVVFASVVRQQWQWKLSIHCHITLMRSDESKDDRMPTLLDWKFCKFIFRKNERNLKLVFMVPPRRWKNKFRDSSMAPLSYSSSYFAPLLPFSGCCSDWGIFWHWRTTCVVLVQFLDCVTLHSLASVYVIS